MTKYKYVIVNVNLQFEVNCDTEKEAQIEAENIELPKEYVSDSFEIVKYLDEYENEVKA